MASSGMMIGRCLACEVADRCEFNKYEYRCFIGKRRFVPTMRLPSAHRAFGMLLIGAAMGAASVAAESGPAPAATVGGSPSAAPLTFVTYRHVDPAVGIEAFRLLIPKGWQVQGTIQWANNPAMPATSRFRFFDPQGSTQFELLPTQSFFWTDNQLFLATNPPGTLRFGTLVAPPVDLEGAFSRVLLPQFRGDIEHFEVLKREAVPELAKLALGAQVPGLEARGDAGKIRFAYRANGQAFEEEMYAAVTNFVTRMPPSLLAGPSFIDYWYIDYVFAFRAGRGELDSNAALFQTMLFSLQVNPQWFAKVVNTKEYLVQAATRGIQAVGRAGEIAARAGSDLRAEQQADWERREAAKDRAAENFSDYVRGVERFTDPHAGTEVELPSGYGHAWANDLGEYVITTSPSYNPNTESNQHWEPMPPSR